METQRTTTQERKASTRQIALRVKKMRRAKRIRVHVQGTPQRPRLSVFRSNQFIYAQLIDDQAGKTLASTFGAIKDAKTIGEQIAKKAIDKKVTHAVFDKGSYTYHGRVKDLADGARAGGLNF